MANVSGTLNIFRVLFQPSLIIPQVTVKSESVLGRNSNSGPLTSELPGIKELNFRALKEAGYTGAVFDKDNCLVRPFREMCVLSVTFLPPDCPPP